MTRTTKEIFENYQIRKNKKQKTTFIEYVKAIAEQNGYPVTVEKGSFGARNIVIGDPDNAKALYTAHYDTCPRLPFPNFLTPKNLWIYTLYQLALVIPMMVAMLLGAYLVGNLFYLIVDNFAPSFYENPLCFLIDLFLREAVMLSILLPLLIGPANNHTANDNTSGVTTIIDIMCALDQSQRDKVAFILFDLEEWGLIGSSSFAKKHKKTLNNKLVLNFDCVSDGENMIFAVKKKAKEFAPMLKKAFETTDAVKVEIATKGIFYPSDNMSFKGGVGVAAFKKTKKRGILYMDKIHTNKDTVYREENIEYLKNGSIKLLEQL